MTNCVIKDCPGIAMYKVGARGFCFKHKQEAFDYRKGAQAYRESHGANISQNNNAGNMASKILRDIGGPR